MAIAVSGHFLTGGEDQLWLVAADGHATQVLKDGFYPVLSGGF